ncbi:MAG: phosphotransferase [Cognaticolwellia sp.]
MSFEQSVTLLADVKQQELARTLAQLPCFKPLRLEKVRAISAGLSQPCFYLRHDNQDYFAKRITNNSAEPFASKLAAKQGIAPKVIYSGQNWLITEFIAGEGLDSCVINHGDNDGDSTKDKLVITLALLARCHRTPHVIASQDSTNQDSANQNLQLSQLDIAATIKPLLQAVKLGTKQQNMLQALSDLLLQNLARAVEKQSKIEQVFCHGDANFSNVIRLEKRAEKPCELTHKLVDFECASIAPIAYDLAMLMAVNAIDVSEVSTIVSLYLQACKALERTEHPFNIVDNLAPNSEYVGNISPLMVTCYHELSLLINGLWYLSQCRSKKHSNYLLLAIKQLTLLASRYSQLNPLLAQMR